MALGELASLEEARDGRPRLVRADRLRARRRRPSGTRRAQRFAALAPADGAGGRRRERDADRAARHPGAGGPLGRERGGGRTASLDGLVYRSNLLGADRALANQSAAATRPRRRRSPTTPGREVARALGEGLGHRPGHDHAAGFAGLRLDEVLPLREREAMDDADDGRVPPALRASAPTSRGRRSRRCCTRSCRPPHVDHTHPDAVIALTSTPDGRRLAEEAFGDEAVWLDYQRPGFDMSRRIAELLEAKPAARAVLLERHGLVTWGATRRGELPRARSSSSAARPQAIDRAASGRFGLGGRKVAERGERRARPPCSRRRCPRSAGRCSPRPAASILEVDRSPEAVAFASLGPRARGEPGRRALPRPPDPHEAQAARASTSTRDATAPPSCGEAFRAGVEEYARWYRAYYERNLDDETRPFPIDPAGPRVVLVPGVGIVTCGADAGRARVARDLYHRAIAVEDAADASAGSAR